MELGTLKWLELKNLWTGEASQFTPCLSENLAVLDEKLGMDLELETREATAGDFTELATIRKWAIETLLKLKAIFPKRIENCTKPPQT
jgi:hypothetical protein